jgi:hypothetical protein
VASTLWFEQGGAEGVGDGVAVAVGVGMATSVVSVVALVLGDASGELAAPHAAPAAESAQISQNAGGWARDDNMAGERGLERTGTSARYAAIELLRGLTNGHR